MVTLKDVITDDLLFVRTFLRIPDKQQRIVPLIPKPCQERFVTNLTGRDIAVKPAQLGMTTIASALILKRTLTTPNTTSVIVAHEEFLTQRLLHRTQVMYDNLPDFLKIPMDHRSSYEKRFTDINSVLYIGTARSQVFGRGEPIHNLLFSEEAFYVPDALERVILPSLQRVPPTGSVIRESTPHGETNSFYDEVSLALEGKSTFHLQVFFWWDEPDNYLPISSPRALPEDRDTLTYTPDESNLAKTYGLSEGQIRWRRWKIRELGDLFWQEHPEDLATCFLTTGQSYYDQTTISTLAKQCYKAPHSGPENAEVWFPPEEGVSYIMGVDPGQGKVSQSVATVWRLLIVDKSQEGKSDVEIRVRHEATLSGLIEPDLMGYKCKELGRYYNTAMIIPEANSHGLALVAAIKDYPSLYFRRNIISGQASSDIGWLTTSNTKPFMMQQLQSRLKTIETHDAELVRQIASFREVGLNKVVTQGADDYHDSACLAMVGLVTFNTNRRRGFIEHSGWRW